MSNAANPDLAAVSWTLVTPLWDKDNDKRTFGRCQYALIPMTPADAQRLLKLEELIKPAREAGATDTEVIIKGTNFVVGDTVDHPDWDDSGNLDDLIQDAVSNWVHIPGATLNVTETNKHIRVTNTGVEFGCDDDENDGDKVTTSELTWNALRKLAGGKLFDEVSLISQDAKPATNAKSAALLDAWSKHYCPMRRAIAAHLKTQTTDTDQDVIDNAFALLREVTDLLSTLTEE